MIGYGRAVIVGKAARPAISTGVYGYPRAAAAEIAVSTLSGAATGVGLARLVAFDAETRRLYGEALRRHQQARG